MSRTGSSSGRTHCDQFHSHLGHRRSSSAMSEQLRQQFKAEAVRQIADALPCDVATAERIFEQVFDSIGNLIIDYPRLKKEYGRDLNWTRFSDVLSEHMTQALAASRRSPTQITISAGIPTRRSRRSS